MPLTSHANAACCSTKPKSSPQINAPASRTAVGAIRFRRSVKVTLSAGPAGLMKEMGLVNRPTIRARLKLSVASDERNMPRSRSEKQRISWYCWAVGV